MVPLHYAFATKDQAGIRDFETLMSRFAMQELKGGQLEMAQWMYLVSRYLSLRVEFGYPLRAIDKILTQRVATWLHVRWEYEPGFRWRKPPFIGTKARIAYVRTDSTDWPLSYYPAITDYELFLFATASDISYTIRNHPELIERNQHAISTSLTELISTGIEIIGSNGEFNEEGGWLFQKGIWTDHPDFRFAGHTELNPDLPEVRLSNISEDSSHSHRWPFF
jgi:hypothetical protein